MAALSAHPETRSMAMILAPYRAMAGQPEEIEQTVDLVAGMWERTREGGDT